MSQDDNLYYGLSAKQAEYKIGKRRLAKLPERVYDRDDLRREPDSLLTVEQKYANQFLLEEIFGKQDEKKEAKA